MPERRERSGTKVPRKACDRPLRSRFTPREPADYMEKSVRSAIDSGSTRSFAIARSLASTTVKR